MTENHPNVAGDNSPSTATESSRTEAPQAQPRRPAVRIVGRGDGVVVQINSAGSMWPQVLEMLGAHFTHADGFFRGERITLELGAQAVDESELRQLLNLLAEQQINLRALRTSNADVHQLARECGLTAVWQAVGEQPRRDSALQADANWEVLLSDKDEQAVADFQMPTTITDALVHAIHEEGTAPPHPEDGPVDSTDNRELSIAPAVQSAVIAHPTEPNLVQRVSAPPYLYRGTLRSGQVFRHAGPVIVVGDVNPGAQVVSASDIYVWGRLRGIIHAGAMGDENKVVGALDFEPIQVRIAGFIAMSPKGEDSDPGRWFWKRQSIGKPEMARVVKGRIVVDPWDARLMMR